MYSEPLTDGKRDNQVPNHGTWLSCRSKPQLKLPCLPRSVLAHRRGWLVRKPEARVGTHLANGQAHSDNLGLLVPI